MKDVHSPPHSPEFVKILSTIHTNTKLFDTVSCVGSVSMHFITVVHELRFQVTFIYVLRRPKIVFVLWGGGVCFYQNRKWLALRISKIWLSHNQFLTKLTHPLIWHFCSKNKTKQNKTKRKQKQKQFCLYFGSLVICHKLVLKRVSHQRIEKNTPILISNFDLTEHSLCSVH